MRIIFFSEVCFAGSNFTSERSDSIVEGVGALMVPMRHVANMMPSETNDFTLWMIRSRIIFGLCHSTLHFTSAKVSFSVKMLAPELVPLENCNVHIPL